VTSQRAKLLSEARLPYLTDRFLKEHGFAPPQDSE
jgi:hypothetical protein